MCDYRIYHSPRLRRWDSRDRYRSSSVAVCRRTSCRTGNYRFRMAHLFNIRRKMQRRQLVPHTVLYITERKREREREREKRPLNQFK